jgi:hypothetical protein
VGEAARCRVARKWSIASPGNSPEGRASAARRGPESAGCAGGATETRRRLVQGETSFTERRRGLVVVHAAECIEAWSLQAEAGPVTVEALARGILARSKVLLPRRLEGQPQELVVALLRLCSLPCLRHSWK